MLLRTPRSGKVTARSSRWGTASGLRVVVILVDRSQGGMAVAGVIALDLFTKELHVFAARSVVLATRGFVRMYRWALTPWRTTGEGLAALVRAGIRLRDADMAALH